MRNGAHLIAQLLGLCCEADRVLDRFLYGNGFRRRFHSTKGQDRWVVKKVLNGWRGGFFVEVGAADGRTHSNTYILERDYNWLGLAVEANPRYFPALRRNRKCICVQACIDAAVGEIDFYCGGFLGGIIDQDTDNAYHRRGAILDAHAKRIVRLKTVSLQDLLDAHGAPSTIDYLSLDVEGAEYRILRNFPFDRFRFQCLTVERPTRTIHKLLQQAGYVLDRVYRFDGFYVSPELASRLEICGEPFDGVATKSF